MEAHARSFNTPTLGPVGDGNDSNYNVPTRSRLSKEMLRTPPRRCQSILKNPLLLWFEKRPYVDLASLLRLALTPSEIDQRGGLASTCNCTSSREIGGPTGCSAAAPHMHACRGLAGIMQACCGPADRQSPPRLTARREAPWSSREHAKALGPCPPSVSAAALSAACTLRRSRAAARAGGSSASPCLTARPRAKPPSHRDER